jgi:hypothetical protein
MSLSPAAAEISICVACTRPTSVRAFAAGSRLCSPQMDDRRGRLVARRRRRPQPAEVLGALRVDAVSAVCPRLRIDRPRRTMATCAPAFARRAASASPMPASSASSTQRPVRGRSPTDVAGAFRHASPYTSATALPVDAIDSEATLSSSALARTRRSRRFSQCCRASKA